jgi:hypothetical protein
MSTPHTSAGGSRAPGHDDGVALILVIAWGMLVMGLTLVLAQSVIRQIVPSSRSEHSYAALAAAEAGVEDYRARLLVNATYYTTQDATNAALGGWVPVPGGDTDSEFTYAIDSSRAGIGGGLRVYSTGRSGGVTRTVEAVLGRRSTLDYTYMSDLETTAPTFPAAYSTVAGTGGTGSTAQDLAKLLCARHWWDPTTQTVSPTATGNQRNQNFCQWARIAASEVLGGRLHTNDVWRLEDANLQIGAGKLTSSCPSKTSEGLVTGGVACPELHRYVSVTDSVEGLYNNNGIYRTWTTSTAFQGTTWRPSAAAAKDATPNPAWDSVLELPADPSLLLERASDAGCVYTGPTRIRFDTELVGGVKIGYMYVTSPDTLNTAAACGGTSLANAANVGAPQKTVKIDLTDKANLVVYVQNVRRSTEADVPANAYDLNNRWAMGPDGTTGTEPSCAYKTVKYSVTGNVGTVTGSSSPWTAPITGMTRLAGGLVVGSAFTATAGSGSIGTGGTYTVKTIPGTTSITFTATGGTKPTAGSVANITISVKYPYVIPLASVDSGEAGNFTGKSGNQGFPSEYAPTGSAFFGGSCSLGDVYVQGLYKGQVTIATENNVIVTKTLITSDSNTTTGKPPGADVGDTTQSTSLLGLVSNNFAYVYRPLTAKDAWATDWPAANATAPKINAALLAVNQCWGSQREFTTSAGVTSLTFWGSLAQKYRCPVGETGTAPDGTSISGGYQKDYHYDNRFARQTPPSMVELSFEPWVRNTFGEVTPKVQPVGTATWPLLQSTDTGATFANVRVEDGPATAVKSGTSAARVTATAPGLIVVVFDVTKTGVTETRHLIVTAQ